MLFEKIAFEKSEELIKVVRKHWFIIVIELAGITLLALIPLVTLLLIYATDTEVTVNLDEHLLSVLFGTLCWLIICCMMAVMAWTHYFLDLWIITDRRIIVIEQIHFFNRKVGSFRLERMQDIKVKITGIIPTLLNFGTLRAQTASAAESNFTNNGLPNPRELQSLIQKAMDERLKVLQSGGAYPHNR